MTDDLEDFEFAVVERFPQAFSRSRTAVLATPRELTEHLVGRSEPLADQRSIKQHAFYFIRALLARQLERSREDITPQVRLEELMPDPEQRRQDWKIIRAALGVPHFPRLGRSHSLEWMIALVVAVSSFAVFLLAGLMLAASWAVLPIGFGFAGTCCGLLLRATDRWATRFVPPTLTVGDLASYSTAFGSKVPGISVRPSTRSQIMEVVRDLVRLEIGATKIDMDATWAKLLASARSAA
jgi:hypothetical protein